MLRPGTPRVPRIRRPVCPSLFVRPPKEPVPGVARRPLACTGPVRCPQQAPPA